jgi:hypothetical protein
MISRLLCLAAASAIFCQRSTFFTALSPFQPNHRIIHGRRDNLYRTQLYCLLDNKFHFVAFRQALYQVDLALPAH